MRESEGDIDLDVNGICVHSEDGRTAKGRQHDP
jgi:hypothetical protein